MLNADGIFILKTERVTMTLNRLSGLVMALLGAVMLFWVIPDQTETVRHGWLEPDTLPNIIMVTVILLGLFHFILPTGTATFDIKVALRISLFFGMALSSLYLMSIAGYRIAAPVMVLVIQLLIGERRPLWLISGVVLLPAVIWLAVEVLLELPLP
jgi:putative tricarboxylic transport membrane protein